jgi:hypothetical protein
MIIVDNPTLAELHKKISEVQAHLLKHSGIVHERLTAIEVAMQGIEYNVQEFTDRKKRNPRK